MKRLTIALSLLLLTVGTTRATAQGTWAERLGFEAGKRVVIMYADDSGAAYEFNAAAQKGLESGMIHSAGVMVPGPWSPEFAQWRADHPSYDVGVSLSLISPSDAVRWGPISSRSAVPSLVGADGFFSKSVLQFALRADAKHVRAEIEAQIDQARAMGLKPTHIVPHMGTLAVRPDLMKIYLATAEKYWIPAVMVEFTPKTVEQFRAEGYPLEQELLDAAAKYTLPKLDELVHVPDGDRYEEKREKLFETVRSLSPGITQIFLTPAEGSAALRRMSTRWKNRTWEAKLLQDKDVQDFFKNEEIVFTNWREIMERFETVDMAGGERRRRQQASE